MDPKLITFLQELKQYGIQQNIPNISEREGCFLNMLLKIRGAKNALEIGCANGYSTSWLAEAMKHNGGHLSTIDFSAPTFESAKVNLSHAGLADVVDFYFGNALTVIPTLDQWFDFVFVDGEKRSYWDFWEAIQGHLAPHAVVVFDDVLSFPHKTESFMQAIKNVLGFEQVILPLDMDDGILFLYKTT